ncbi:MAG: hypothetical protein JWN03_6454 [Nocardia sp.]|nr:hypothetical protein [Nocardia sp.]
MPTRHTASSSLSDTEIQHITAEIAAGRPPRVWFTAEAVGMPEGQSGKVRALADPNEPDYLRVQPTGSDDTLAFSPTELTLTKPSRRRTTHQRPDTEPPTLFDDIDGEDRASGWP